MKENRDKDLDHNIEIGDDQERLFFQFNLIKDIKFKDDPNFNKIITEFQTLRIVLSFSIFLGIILFFMFILVKINYIIILIDLSVVLSYYLYFRYLKNGYKNKLNKKLTKKEFRFIINEKKKSERLSVYQLIFNILIITLTLFLLFISFLEKNSLLFILILTTSLIYLITEG